MRVEKEVEQEFAPTQFKHVNVERFKRTWISSVKKIVFLR